MKSNFKQLNWLGDRTGIKIDGTFIQWKAPKVKLPSGNFFGR
jgi:hypothetical protein